MRIVSIGGGPAGLYFGILAKQALSDVSVEIYERNRADDTFGFGVVFSDATLGNLARADEVTYQAIREHFAHWDDIDIHFGGQVWRSTGHGFCGLGRKQLLLILQQRCRELGVELHFEKPIDDIAEVSDADLVVAADGVGSLVRSKLADHFLPDVEMRPNRFVWLGTTVPFDAFKFYFKESEHGLFRVHAYRYSETGSTFIVECTGETFERTGLDENDEDAAIDYIQRLFGEELAGHPLIKNRSIWRQFPTVKCGRWHHDNVVLLGDAVHTAHFSIGSGTKLAMEDAIDLVDALVAEADIPTALQTYERTRRPEVEATQRAAQVSLEWFENTERYMNLAPAQFAFSLLTRSLRVTHENLRVRDPELVDKVDVWFAGSAGKMPPMFVPYRLGPLDLANRVVVAPIDQGRASNGVVGEWELVHLASRAIGGAGLLMAPAAIESAGRQSANAAGMFDEDCATGWKRIVDFVHGSSMAKVGLQLCHAGRKAIGDALRSASSIPWTADAAVPREMNSSDMTEVLGAFVAAAERAAECGFDAIEIDASCGGLLASFISPLTNHRDDEFGGDLDGRLRYPMEVVRAVRDLWDGALLLRISAIDWAEGGTTGDDAVAIGRAAKQLGVDGVVVVTGGTVADEQRVVQRLYQTPLAERVRLEAGIPTITEGGISSFDDVNSVLAAGRCDLVGLGSAHLFDPYFTRHAAKSQQHAIPWPQPYSRAQQFRPR